jgi:hypothetical protein
MHFQKQLIHDRIANVYYQIEGGVPSIDEILKDIQTIPKRARQLTDEQLAQTLDQDYQKALLNYCCFMTRAISSILPA